MKLGLHAHSLQLAGGLRDYQPVGRGVMTAAQLLDRAAQMKFSAVQLARRNISDNVAEWDMVMLVNLGQQARDKELTLHLSTNILQGEHLADLIRRAHTLGATQVTVGLTELRGNVQQRQRRLENTLADLDAAIKIAERYRVMLAIENGRHTAAVDLAALIQAAQSEWVGACFDMGNVLTVPEDPVEAATVLAPFCVSAHLKDLQVFRVPEGALLVNVPVGEGSLEVTEVLRVLNARKPELVVFLQTGAERLFVPALRDAFLQEYPRITARALAGLLRRGSTAFSDAEHRFPHEGKATEREILKWEEDRLKRSVKQAQKLLGTHSLTLSLE